MRLVRLAALAVFAQALLTASLVTSSQPTGKVPRVGDLCTYPCGGTRYQAFVQSREAHGHVNGRTITLLCPPLAPYAAPKPMTLPDSLRSRRS